MWVKMARMQLKTREILSSVLGETITIYVFRGHFQELHEKPALRLETHELIFHDCHGGKIIFLSVRKLYNYASFKHYTF